MLDAIEYPDCFSEHSGRTCFYSHTVSKADVALLAAGELLTSLDSSTRLGSSRTSSFRKLLPQGKCTSNVDQNKHEGRKSLANN